VVVRNVSDTEERVGQSRHGGAGVISQRRVFEVTDFDSRLSVVAFDTLPPGAEIGLHHHRAEEELYIIVAGDGTVIVDGTDTPIRAGDVVLTKPGSSHAVRNTSASDLSLIAIEVRLCDTQPAGQAQ
jgi:mannose-6-phosphate isomerase-like protein (cupin superfamily)